MKTIIHIGQHKTGTTSIQHFLQDNRGELAKTGLYVPLKIAGYDHPCHFILNVYSMDEDRYSNRKEKIIAKKGKQYLLNLETELKKDIKSIYNDAFKHKCNSLIWSSEGLYLLNSAAEYNRLISLFSDYSTEIDVVCCFRDVESYKDSYIKQLGKQNITLSNNPDSYRYVEPDSWLFDYKRKKALLSEAFDNCKYFSYDADDNVKIFLKAIGINNISSGRYRLNVTESTHNNLLQRIKKCFGFFYR